MTISRRSVLASALAAPAIAASTRLGSAAPAQTLKISHQFPGGTIDEGDFRDRLCRKFAAELEKRTDGAIAAQVYPNSSLMKTVAQFSAVRKGVLDLSLYPISYAGGEFAELNIGLMPGLVSSYKQGGAWKQAQVVSARCAHEDCRQAPNEPNRRAVPFAYLPAQAEKAAA